MAKAGDEGKKQEAVWLDISLFGNLEVRVNGLDVTRLASRRAMLLLAVLALRGGKPIERQRLAGMLWPDSPDAGALHNLRQTLAALRRAMGRAAELVQTASPRSIRLELTPQVRVDVLQFDDACAESSRTSLEGAIELYCEPLLMGIDEPFAVEARERREQAFLDGVDGLAASYVSDQEHALAAGILRRAFAVDPYRERTCRTLMKALAACGEAPAALEAYRELRLRLRRDLKVDPDGDTKALYRSIRDSISSPKRTSDARVSGLPIPLSPLIGRKSEIEEVARLLDRCRLVTLTGVGGVGKTRLAIAAAAAAEERYLDGARFVDLTPVESASMVPSAIAKVLNIQDHSDKPLAQALAERLKGREMLLVLDNCEHLAKGVAETLETLLSLAPDLHVLATSRQSLGLSGEHVWRVPTLSMPAAAQDSDDQSSDPRSELLLGSDAVRLFLDRSQGSLRPEGMSFDSLERVASICAKLEGIPLAIELAAARTRVLSVAEIDDRLADRFVLLAGGNPTVARHQTLEAAIEWSWDMLTPLEQALLMRLSVFRGGCSIGAVEAVTAGEHQAAVPLDLLASLVDRCLINRVASDLGTRFTMLETIRQFALGRLRERGWFEEACNAHRDFFLEWVQQSRTQAASSDEPHSFALFETEHDNLRAALDWCHRKEEGELALCLATSLCRFWDTHGHLSEGRSRIEAALKLGEDRASSAIVAGAHVQAGWMATVQRDCQAACGHYENALAIRPAPDDIGAHVKILNCLGIAYFHDGQFDAARLALERALEIAVPVGNLEMVSTTLSNLGEVALATGEFERARSCLEKSLAHVGGPDKGNQEQRGQTLCSLSVVDVQEERFADAQMHALDGLRRFRDSALIVDIPDALSQIGIVESFVGDPYRAVRLMSASEELSAELGVSSPPYSLPRRELAKQALRGKLGDTAYELAARAGRSMTINEAVALALS